MPQAQPIPIFGHWGSDGEPPLPPRLRSLQWWIAGCALGLLWLSWTLGWLGLPVAIGSIAWCFLGAKLADPGILSDVAPSFAQTFVQTSRPPLHPVKNTEENRSVLIPFSLHRRLSRAKLLKNKLVQAL